MTAIAFAALGFAAIIVFGTVAACLYDSLEARLPALRSSPYGGSGGLRGSPATAARNPASFAPTASADPFRRGVHVSRERRSGTRERRRPERRVSERRGWERHGPDRRGATARA